MSVHGLGDCNGVYGDSEARGGGALGIIGLGVMLIPVTADGALPHTSGQVLVPLRVGELPDAWVSTSPTSS